MRLLGALTALLLISCSSVAGYLRAQHYAELELAQGAAGADVRAAYRRLALKLHPDKVRAAPRSCWCHAQAQASQAGLCCA